MIQRVKALAAKPDDLRLFSRTHRKERTDVHNLPFDLPHMHHPTNKCNK